MKKTNYSFWALFGLIMTSITFTSCEKNDEPTPLGTETEISETSRKKAKAKELIFLAGHNQKSWMIDKYLLNGNDVTNLLFGECSLDNIQVFTTKGEYIEYEGASKCDPSHPDIFDSGTFTFSKNFRKITISSQHLNQTLDIIDIKPFTVKAKYIDPVAGEIQMWLKPAPCR